MISTAPQSNNYLELQMSPVWEMNADSFFDFCQLNSHLRIERNATGKLIIMSFAVSETGNGVSLGWLINRPKRRVYIYTSDHDKQCLDNPQTISGDPLLSDFVLDLVKIW